MALSLSSGAVCTAKHRKNSKLKLYNQFLFCNTFLPLVRYLHSGQEDMFIDKKPCFLDKKTGRHDVRVRDEEYRIYFAITDLSDSSEATPLREQFSERSTNSVIVSFLTLSTYTK